MDRPDLQSVSEFLRFELQDELVAIDLETKGTNSADPSSFIAGVGFAHQGGCFYIHLLGASDEVLGYIRKWLIGAKRLTSFNVLFDGAFLQAFTGKWLNWEYDSYGLFKLLSTEGYPTQRWDLGTAQHDLLGWATSNKTVLADALKTEGLTKAEMWRLPAQVLGHYCAIDADAHWQVLEELLTQCGKAEWGAAVLDYHTRLYMTEVKLLAEQQLRGLVIDQQLINACHSGLLTQILATKEAFLQHPLVAPHIIGAQERARDAWIASRPNRWTGQGVQSKNYERWVAREEKALESGAFNINSKPQLADLFYTKLGFKIAKYTATGKPVVDRKVLPYLGEPGKLLSSYNVFLKRRGYVERIIERSAASGVVHPQFNSMGAVSTRLGGSGGVNFQQLFKDPAFLAAFKARPGFKLVQADAEALEPTILAEFSQDKTLLSVYGKDLGIVTTKRDIYLHIAANINALGTEIRKFYDPENPTPEGTKAAKKACKRDRAVAKKFHLMSTYKAGPAKIKEEMELEGIHLSLKEVREIHRDYWDLFRGVLRFEEKLQSMWMANGGWIPSIFGTPIAVADSLLKDINNRFCQYSGHVVLQLWIYYIEVLRQERGVEMYPWLVDGHDDTVWEVPEEQAAAAAQIIDDALALANEELGMEIPIKGPSMIVDNLAEIKCEDYEAWLETRGVE